MKSQTKIEWTDATWNPLVGCSKVSAGCKNCYAIKDAVRLAGNPNPKIAAKYKGTTENGNWTGRINLASDDVLTQPIRATRPRRYFVNSMSDLFHESVSDEWIARIFAAMAASPQHTFQILTKRADRMLDFFRDDRHDPRVNIAAWMKGNHQEPIYVTGQYLRPWPLPNVWLGVSVEDQKAADERIEYLRQTPAAVRWLSVEPLLGHVELSLQGIDWVVVGGESGPNARPCNIDWIRSMVRQCQSAGIPVFVKQLGSNLSEEDAALLDLQGMASRHPKGGESSEWPEDLRVRMFPGRSGNEIRINNKRVCE